MAKQFISINDLEVKTEEFFHLHWNPKIHGSLLPKWDIWNFKGPIPNNEKRGCYALPKLSDSIVKR